MENPEDFPESDLSPGFSIAALRHFSGPSPDGDLLPNVRAGPGRSDPGSLTVISTGYGKRRVVESADPSGSR